MQQWTAQQFRRPFPKYFRWCSTAFLQRQITKQVMDAPIAAAGRQLFTFVLAEGKQQAFSVFGFNIWADPVAVCLPLPLCLLPFSAPTELQVKRTSGYLFKLNDQVNSRASSYCQNVEVTRIVYSLKCQRTKGVLNDKRNTFGRH